VSGQLPVERVYSGVIEAENGRTALGQSGLFYETLKTLWPLSRVFYQLGNRRGLRPLSGVFFRALKSEAIIIPIHEAIANPESVVLPYPLLTPLIERTSTRVLMNECMCRRGERCQNYPQDFGCLYLGDGAAKIRPSMGRLVDSREAIAHVEEAMALGLVPLVVHTSFDALALGISYRRMLGICFCCDCCCTIQQGLRLGPPSFWDIVVRLPGLQVEVNERCTGCGACGEACYVEAVSVYDGRAQIDQELCKGCGRCLTACPFHAITLRLENEVDMMSQLMSRIARRTDIGLSVEDPALDQR
jgi:UDP-glucose 4-epimerase